MFDESYWKVKAYDLFQILLGVEPMALYTQWRTFLVPWHKILDKIFHSSSRNFLSVIKLIKLFEGWIIILIIRVTWKSHYVRYFHSLLKFYDIKEFFFWTVFFQEQTEFFWSFVTCVWRYSTTSATNNANFVRTSQYIIKCTQKLNVTHILGTSSISGRRCYCYTCLQLRLLLLLRVSFFCHYETDR